MSGKTSAIWAGDHTPQLSSAEGLWTWPRWPLEGSTTRVHWVQWPGDRRWESRHKGHRLVRREVPALTDARVLCPPYMGHCVDNPSLPWICEVRNHRAARRTICEMPCLQLVMCVVVVFKPSPQTTQHTMVAPTLSSTVVRVSGNSLNHCTVTNAGRATSTISDWEGRKFLTCSYPNLYRESGHFFKWSWYSNIWLRFTQKWLAVKNPYRICYIETGTFWRRSSQTAGLRIIWP